MPKGPKGEHRPSDVIGAAVKVMRIATGEEEDAPPPDDGKNAAAVSLGKRGGAARAAAMTPERRTEIARKAAAKRWGPSTADATLDFLGVFCYTLGSRDGVCGAVWFENVARDCLQ